MEKKFNDKDAENGTSRRLKLETDDDRRRHDNDVFQQNFRAIFEAGKQAERQSSPMNDAMKWARANWFKLTAVTLLLAFIVKKTFFANEKVALKSNQTEQIAPTERQDNKITTTNDTKTAAEPTTTPLSILSDFLPSVGSKSAEMPTADDATKVAYMKRFAQVAVNERRKYGVPASLILANAVRQSAAGLRDVTAAANNHFNLPCTFDWSGATVKSGSDCLRRYENAWLSFRDHSVFLTSGKFADLRRLGDKDYRAWARGLQQLGYPSATPDLASDLIQIIEKYKLDQLDKVP